MNAIHIRFVKGGKITGYAKCYPHNGWLFDTLPSSVPCDLIERGIEIRGEVWYEGDRFEYDGEPGTLAWNDECGMFTLNLDDFPYKTITVNMMVASCTRRIGNIHEGEKA